VFFLRFRESVKKAQWKQAIESHQEILDALRDGKLETACEAMRSHIESHRQRMEARS
jgi:DNA-binding GntR family transcriptional regulator